MMPRRLARSSKPRGELVIKERDPPSSSYPITLYLHQAHQ